MATSTTETSINNMIELYRNAHGRKGRDMDSIAWAYYVEYTLYAEILNAFLNCEEMSEQEIEARIRSNIDKSFDHCVTALRFYAFLLNLCSLGYLERREENVMYYKITEIGYNALRQQTFTNIALSALSNIMANASNETTIELNKRIKKLTIIMAVITGLGVIIAAIQLTLQIL